MSKTITNDTPHYTLYHHPESNIIHLEVHKSITGESFRHALTEGLELLKKNRATKWLSDGRHSGVLSVEDAEWGLTIWAPKIVAAGWKYWALVLPDLVMGRLNMKFFVEQYSQKGITVELFDDPDKALDWLEKVS